MASIGTSAKRSQYLIPSDAFLVILVIGSPQTTMALQIFTDRYTSIGDDRIALLNDLIPVVILTSFILTG